MASSKSSKIVAMIDRSRNPSSSLFKDVSFYLVDETNDEVKNLLKQCGAKREFYISELVTHVITDTISFPEYEQAKDAKLDIVKIPKNDRDALWAMITYNGGVCQPNLNGKCTHLATGKASGRKFEFASQKPEQLKVVTPDWILGCIKAGTTLDESEYFPLEEAPKTPESTKPGEASPARNISTPKMNDGTPSTLLTPVTPTVTQGSAVKVLSPKKQLPSSPASEGDDLESRQASNGGMQAERANKDKPDVGTKTAADSTTTGIVGSSVTAAVAERNPDILKGCVFVFGDYMERLPEETFKIWLDVITKHGGEVEDTYSKRSTHVLCLHQQGELCKKALADGKKIATAHWLNEVLVKSEFFTPCYPLHIPVPFSSSVSGCKDMIVTVSGYTGAERFLVKNMISILGANYTGYFTQAHSHLVCKKPEGRKYEKALEWGVSIVNAKWLGDMLQAGQVFPSTGLARYTKLGEADELILNEEYAKEIMAAWKEPQEKTDAVADDDTSKSKKRKQPDTTEAIVMTQDPASKQRKTESTEEKPQAFVLFTGLTGPAVNTYTQMLKKMKGEIAKGVKNCTHLIAPKITRTVKFLSAISVVNHIVTPSWIEESNKVGSLLDEAEYSLKDPESEEYFGFKLDVSMQRSRTRKVFQGLKFFVTPKITPAPGPMKEIIECAGGEMVELKDGESAFAQFLESKIKKKENSYVVTCEEDRGLWEPLHKEGHEVYNVELVLSGVMKQELEWESYPFL
eukprot:gene12733-3459_t